MHNDAIPMHVRDLCLLDPAAHSSTAKPHRADPFKPGGSIWKEMHRARRHENGSY